MSTYTTGEIAKLCDVTVRTVQYYDSRGILIPSDFSEGGRRLFTDEDVQKLKLICFLRDMGLAINSIADIMKEENASHVIGTLLEEKERTVRSELKEKQIQLERITELQKELEKSACVSVKNLSDIAYFMENKKKLKKVRGTTLAVGFVMDATQIATFCLGIMKGIWLPFALGMIFVIVCCIVLVRYYYRNTLYICPECHKKFRPAIREFFWAAHTPRTRKLTCSGCHFKGFVVETYGKEEE